MFHRTDFGGFLVCCYKAIQQLNGVEKNSVAISLMLNHNLTGLCGLSLLLVLSLALRGFSPGIQVFPLLKNQHFQMYSIRKYPYPLTEGPSTLYPQPTPRISIPGGACHTPLPARISMIFHLGWVPPWKEYFLQKCCCTILQREI